MPSNPLASRLRALLVTVTAVAGACCARSEDAVRPPLAVIEVDAGEFERWNSPMTTALPVDLAIPPGGEYALVGGNGAAAPCQASPDGRSILWSLPGGANPGVPRRFELRPWTPEAPNHMTVAATPEALQIQSPTGPVVRYNTAVVPPPEGSNPLYARSGFFHPVWSPGGEVLSRIHPPDHIHHLGLWNPWTKVRIGDRTIDCWNLASGQGLVRYGGEIESGGGPACASFVVRQEHVDLKAPGGELVFLRERLTVRAWQTGDGSRWIMDLESRLECTAGEPVLLEAYRYGGLGFRGRAEWDNDNSDYRTSEGKTRTDGDATRARWCDVYGDAGDGVSGILFMDHPANRDHPQPMRIWPPDSNGGKENVFFNFCPIRENEWLLEPGAPQTLRYRLVGHEGPMGAEEAEALWRDFANPPDSRAYKP